MLWSLYVWHSEMVLHPLSLSEKPEHLCGHLVRRLFTQFQKSVGAGLPGVELFPESLSSQMDSVVPKTQARHRRDKRILCP